MNRRGFLAGLLGTAATLTLDPERALWVPGEKTIFVPPLIVPPAPLDLAGFMHGDVITFEGVFELNPFTHEIAQYHDPLTGNVHIFLKRFMVTGDGSLWPIPMTEGPYANTSKIPRGRPLPLGS